jgi:hypothetical protein
MNNLPILAPQEDARVAPNNRQVQPAFITVNSNHWDNDWDIITVDEACDDNFDAHAENKVLIGVLISVKHCGSSQNTQQTRGRTASGASNFQALRYTNKSLGYDRILMFANVRMNGRCFAILTDNPFESQRVLQCSQESTIGDYFVIVEPDMPTNYLQDCPIVTAKWPIYPLQRPTIVNNVPLCPPDPGKQLYFSYRSMQLEISKATIESAGCNGTFCDRHMTAPTSRGNACGCLYKSNSASIVLSMNVSFCYTFDGQARCYTVTGYRSWRTTMLYLKPINRSTDISQYQTHRNIIRPTVRAITDIINANGGWDIFGWFRRGEVADISASSSQNNVDIASANIPIHLSYVFPSRLDILPQVHAERYPPAAPAVANNI